MKRYTLLFVLVSLFSLTYSQTQYPTVIMETTEGTLKLMLYDDTFRHSDNFVKLVNEGYYDGLLFHRVINNFVIQTGDHLSKDAHPGVSLGHGGKKYTIDAEFFPQYYHKKGALSAARQGDATNPKKESSGSQFYIVHGKPVSEQIQEVYVEKGMHVPFTDEQKALYATLGGTPHLDYSYTVFGEVTEGIHILDKIAAVATDRRDRPVEDVKIIKMYTVK